MCPQRKYSSNAVNLAQKSFDFRMMIFVEYEGVVANNVLIFILDSTDACVSTKTSAVGWVRRLCVMTKLNKSFIVHTVIIKIRSGHHLFRINARCI